jgi:hypothetical protein
VEHRDPAFSYPDASSPAYAAALPFPHAVVDGAWDPELLRRCKQQLAGFTDWAGEKNFYGSQRKRFCGDIDRLPPAVVQVIQESGSPRFLSWLEALTGEKCLLPDPYLEGGGAHQIGTGGFLKVHADFNWNKRLQLYRRLNILIYLNEDWDEAWGGELELWATDMSRRETAVPPRLGKMVVFTTDDRSFHGHPEPLRCPENVTRDSIALYYYSPIKPETNFAAARDSTDYRAAGGETLGRKKPSLIKRLFERS